MRPVGGFAPGTTAERLANARNKNNVPSRGRYGHGSRRMISRTCFASASTTISRAAWSAPARTLARRSPSQEIAVIAAMITQVVTTGRLIGTGPMSKSRSGAKGLGSIVALAAHRVSM